MTSTVTLTMNPAVDISAAVDRVVEGRKLRLREVQVEPGGGGINVARVVRRLGGEAMAIYLAGGPTGERLRKLCAREGLKQRPIEFEGDTRENLTVREDDGGGQYRFVMPGPQVAPDRWQECLDLARTLEPAPEYLVASGSLPEGVPTDFYARLAGIARQRGMRLVVDTSGDPLRAVVNAGVFLVKPNLAELSSLEGEEPGDDKRQEEIATALVREGKAQVVVVSLGAAGALLVTREGSRRLRAPSVAVRSRVGAGDSMVGGMVHRLSAGDETARAVMFGLAAGAAAVMTPGSELCRPDDVHDLFDRLLAQENAYA